MDWSSGFCACPYCSGREHYYTQEEAEALAERVKELEAKVVTE
jgi:hypothetical protein